MAAEARPRMPSVGRWPGPRCVRRDPGRGGAVGGREAGDWLYNGRLFWCFAKAQPEPMPIYAYQCGDCGFQQDVLQKISEPPRTTCPSCGHESFSKQLSAPAFQLKGTGWYVTDFRDNGKKPADKSGGNASAEAGSGKGAAEAGGSGDASSAPTVAAPAAASPAPTPASAPAKAGD